MRSDKTLKIALTLLNSNDFITVVELAKIHHVSEKTVRNYMPDIEECLHGLAILKVQGQGIRVVANAEEKLIYNAQLNTKNNNEITSLDKTGRKLSILYSFLVEDRTFTIGDLEEEINISRPSVYKVIEDVEIWLSENELKLYRLKKIGFKLEDGEKRIRKATFRWIKEMINYQDECDYDIASDIYLKIPTLFMNIMTSPISYYRNRSSFILAEIEKEYCFYFTPTEFEKLSIYFSIVAKRVAENKNVTLDSGILNRTFNEETCNIVSFLSDLLVKTFSIEFPLNEAAYLSALILTSKRNRNLAPRNIERFSLEKKIVQDLVHLVYDKFNIENTETFEEDLMYHIHFTANKIAFGKDFYNPMKNEIKRKLPIIYSVASEFVPIIESYCGFKVPDDEIAYLTLHIAKAVEGSKKALNTLFVYNQSLAEAKFACEFLKNNFSQLKIKEVLSTREFKDYSINNIQLVIAFQTQEVKKPVELMVIPPIIGVDYIGQITSQICLIYERCNQNRIIKDNDDSQLVTY